MFVLCRVLGVRHLDFYCHHRHSRRALRRQSLTPWVYWAKYIDHGLSDLVIPCFCTLDNPQYVHFLSGWTRSDRIAIIVAKEVQKVKASTHFALNRNVSANAVLCNCQFFHLKKCVARGISPSLLYMWWGGIDWILWNSMHVGLVRLNLLYLYGTKGESLSVYQSCAIWLQGITTGRAA